MQKDKYSLHHSNNILLPHWKPSQPQLPYSASTKGNKSKSEVHHLVNCNYQALYLIKSTVELVTKSLIIPMITQTITIL